MATAYQIIDHTYDVVVVGASVGLTILTWIVALIVW